MTKIQQMRNDVIEQTEKLDIETDLVDDYLAASDKARQMIRRIVWGQAFTGNLNAANETADRYMDILDGLRSLYRAELDTVAIR